MVAIDARCDIVIILHRIHCDSHPWRYVGPSIWSEICAGAKHPSISHHVDFDAVCCAYRWRRGIDCRAIPDGHLPGPHFPIDISPAVGMGSGQGTLSPLLVGLRWHDTGHDLRIVSFRTNFVSHEQQLGAGVLLLRCAGRRVVRLLCKSASDHPLRDNQIIIYFLPLSVRIADSTLLQHTSFSSLH